MNERKGNKSKYTDSYLLIKFYRLSSSILNYVYSHISLNIEHLEIFNVYILGISNFESLFG